MLSIRRDGAWLRLVPLPSTVGFSDGDTVGSSSLLRLACSEVGALVGRGVGFVVGDFVGGITLCSGAFEGNAVGVDENKDFGVSLGGSVETRVGS